MTLFLVRYGEIGLKSQAVRMRFERCLITNLEKSFIREKKECRVTSDRGHLYVEAEDAKIAEIILRHTFGVTSYSKVEKIPSEMSSICEFIEKWSKARFKKGQTFAIRSRRVGHHAYSSQDIAIKTGDVVRLANKDKGAKVDLKNPDLEIFIEVRDNKAYIYGDRVEGPGGMPLGSQGKVVAVVSDAASALACWLIMKRGCNSVVIPLGKNPQVALLEKWTPTGTITLGPPIKKLDEGSIEDVLEFARRKRALAVVLGEKDKLFKKRDTPIFYPIIGMNAGYVKDFIKKVRS
jgi:thiamine biosynthesis protein ThiI